MPRATRRAETFQFSEEAREEIQRALGRHAPVALPRLEAVVRDHLARLARPLGENQPPTPETLLEIKKMHAALQSVIQRIDDVRPSTRRLLQRPIHLLRDLVTFGGSTPPAWQHLTIIHQEAEHCARRLKAFRGRSPGKPLDHARRSLAEDVAFVLHASGIQIAATRADGGGKFAQVLSIIFSELHGRPIQPDFRLIKAIVDAMKELTDSQLRRLIERMADYMNQETPPRRNFWTLLASESPQSNE